ncbi:MAG: BatA domain-containing protein, partial [Planctomycetota bacterium]|nr:BatA domain-containing protein [Planctomycetota bacterium]
MSFVNLGLALGGAAAIAIPIIIHLLFRRRRKPIMWGAMRFLLEAYRRQRRRMTLEQILLLAARCLVILLIALAIGRPALERASALAGGGSRTVYLLIDNGLASSVRDGDGELTALDRHKQAAARILNALNASDRAGLMAMGAPAEPIVSPASADIGAVGELVDGLTATDGPTDIAGALERVRGAIGEGRDASRGQTIVVVLSDFLVGSLDPTAAPAAMFEGVEGVRILAMRPWERAPGNVQIVGVEPLRPVVLTGLDEAGV